MEQRGFTNRQIADLMPGRITQRQIRGLSENGVVVPDIDSGEGHGGRRVYSEGPAKECLIAGSLLKVGNSYRTIGKILKKVRPHLTEHFGRPYTFLIIIHGPKGISLRTESRNAVNASLLHVSDVADVPEFYVINLGLINEVVKNA